jgi:antitoxin (DNA-binding transcriptional repressor) of toxin-antitoxin stability system
MTLTAANCDAKMHHIMAKATVRQLRYNFRAIEARLNRGEEIDLYKRKKMIGRIVPARPQGQAYPDFESISRKIFGTRKFKKTATQMVSEQRGEY